MTVRTADRPATLVDLPAQRSAEHDRPAQAPASPGLQGWSTPQDRIACRWMCVAMLALGLYAALMITLSARVW